MSKGTALKDYVEVDGHDVSNFCSGVNPQFVDTQEDISGFSSTGKDETVPGRRSQNIVCQFFGAYDSSETWDVLYRLYRDRSTFTFKTRPDQTQPVGSTNPSLEGNARIYEWSPNRQRGQVDSFSVTFSAADSDGFEYVET